MSALFAQAAGSGIGTLNLLAGGNDAASLAAYNESYNAYAQKSAALERKNAAETNIASINQDKILSNVQIQMNQAEAEAAAQVSAAVAGVSGSSVDAGMYQIGANASMASAQVEAKADQLTEQQLAEVNSAQVDFNSVPKVSNASPFEAGIAGLGTALGSIGEQDITNMEAQLDTWSN